MKTAVYQPLRCSQCQTEIDSAAVTLVRHAKAVTHRRIPCPKCGHKVKESIYEPIRCPECKSDDLRYSDNPGIREIMRSRLYSIGVFRCVGCRHRFSHFEHRHDWSEFSGLPRSAGSWLFNLGLILMVAGITALLDFMRLEPAGTTIVEKLDLSQPSHALLGAGVAAAGILLAIAGAVRANRRRRKSRA